MGSIDLGNVLFKPCGLWDTTMQTTYEVSSVVMDSVGDSYTSKKNVPINIPLSNTTYWAKTASVNAQINKAQNDINQLNVNKVSKDEITNDTYPIGECLYANLPPASESNKNGYYYCSDGDGTHGAGRYTSNGLAWFWSGNGDKGYNDVRSDIFKIEEDYSKALSSKSYTYVTGSYLTSNGTFVNTANGSTTGIQPTLGFNHISMKSNITSAGYKLAFFDYDKNIISASSVLGDGTSNAISTEIPNTAKYFCCSNYGGGSPTSVLYTTSDTLETVCDNITDVNSTLGKIIDSKKVTGTAGTYLNVGGNVVTLQAGYCTNYVKTHGYSKIKVKTKITAVGYALAFIDIVGNILAESIVGTGQIQEIDMSIPDRTVKVIASGYQYAPELELYNEGDNIEKRVKALETKKLSEINMLIFADSITDCCNITIDANNRTSAYSFRNPSNSYTNGSGQSVSFNMWPKIINDMGICKEIRNYAKAGAKYKDWDVTDGERQKVSYQIQVALNDLNNPNNVFIQDSFAPDIVIFALGTNDGATSNDTYDTAMATEYANLDKTKFCQSVRYAFQTIRQQFPKAMCFCILPIQRAGSDVFSWPTRTNLKRLADRYGYITIDGATESGIVGDNNTWGAVGTTLKDGLHPNEVGQNLMARMIITAIERYYITFTGMN